MTCMLIRYSSIDTLHLFDRILSLSHTMARKAGRSRKRTPTKQAQRAQDTEPNEQMEAALLQTRPSAIRAPLADAPN